MRGAPERRDLQEQFVESGPGRGIFLYGMKTLLLGILATALVVHAGDKTPAPVVVPVQSGGTATTSKFGDGYINRDNKGGTTTTSKFGDGTISRGSGGGSATTGPFGSGYVTRGCPGASGANSTVPGNVIVLPARK